MGPAGPRVHPLAEGRSIFTRDGFRIGKVSELRPPFMKVRGETRRDYWLPTWTIYCTSPLVVMMSFRSEQLAEFALTALPEV
jgi:hypothetical protein